MTRRRRAPARPGRADRDRAGHGFNEAPTTPTRPRPVRRLRQALEELVRPLPSSAGSSRRAPTTSAEAVAELAATPGPGDPAGRARGRARDGAGAGCAVEDVFASVEPEPLAAGTIGQVHRAVLDNGERVVIKVQRPTAESDIMRDLSLLELFARSANRQALRKIVDLRGDRAPSESLRQGSTSSSRRRTSNGCERRWPSRGRAPRVYRLSTSRCSSSRRSRVPVREIPEGPRGESARQLLECYYRQILVEGFFHADPHPGTCLVERAHLLPRLRHGRRARRDAGQLLLLLLAFWQEDALHDRGRLDHGRPRSRRCRRRGREADLTQPCAATVTPRSARSLGRYSRGSRTPRPSTAFGCPRRSS